MNIFKTTAAAFLLALPATTAAEAGSHESATPDPAVTAAGEVARFDNRYWGLNLGYANGEYQTGVPERSESGVGIDVNGALAGIRYGRNFQNGNRVFGYDVELSTGPDGLTPQFSPAGYWNCFTGDCIVEFGTMLSARGRYGVVLPSGETMIYGAAGVTIARYQGGIPGSVQYGPERTGQGFTLALGLEHALNARTSVYGEVSHVDFGTLQFGDAGGGLNLQGMGDFQQLRVGVNFGF